MKRLMLSISIAGLFVVPVITGAAELTAWTEKIKDIVSALRVSVKQVDVSGNKAAAVHVQTEQARSSAAMDTYNREQVRRTVDEYGTTGQLVDPCYQVGMANTGTAIKGKSETNAAEAMRRVYTTGADGTANAGGVSGAFGSKIKVTNFPFASNVGMMSERHLSRYCSVSEAKAGYCILNPNGMQSGDSDFSMHLTPGRTYGWDQTEAAGDFVKTIAPAVQVRAKDCTDVGCRAVAAERRQQEAYMSMSRYSMLRFVESRTTQTAGDAQKGTN